MGDVATVVVRTNHYPATIYFKKLGYSGSVRLINGGKHPSVVKKTMLITGRITINTYDLSCRIDPSCKASTRGARNGQSPINATAKREGVVVAGAAKRICTDLG